jgi:hypothetical protein
VLRSEVGDALLRRVRRREFDVVFIATPCASYSVAHRPQPAALGLDKAQFGGKSFRIGGATDLAAAFGVVKAERLIKQRGRWSSSVQRLYERALAEEHLSASAAIGEAEGRELEALCHGWVQRATFR